MKAAKGNTTASLSLISFMQSFSGSWRWPSGFRVEALGCFLVTSFPILGGPFDLVSLLSIP